MNIYTESARILQSIKKKKGSLKTLVFSSRYHNKRKLYALVCETLKYCNTLSSLLDESKLPQKIAHYDDKMYLWIVLVYELLVGHGLEKTGGIAKLVLKHKAAIDRAHGQFLRSKNVSSLSDLIPTQGIVIALPRYVRINLLKTTREQVVEEFKEEGWKLKQKHSSLVEDVKYLRKKEFLLDEDLFDVIIFRTGTELHQHPLCKSGSIILQDKASCFPVHVLSPPEGSVVIDSCAAPGNKTSHLASLMHNTGQIYAFDKDSKRVKTMDRQLDTAGVTNTETSCLDFLKVDPHDDKYSAVEYAVVDPSCSGSGISGRLNHLIDDEDTTKARLKSLSNFQATVLKHALSFPAIKRVVYSTCSVHAQENEEVVEEVIEHVQKEFKLTTVFPDWPSRGLKGYKHSQFCLRMSPDENLTNGFFVACFERKQTSYANVDGDKISLPHCFEKDETGKIILSDKDLLHLTRKEKRRLKKKAKRAEKMRLLAESEGSEVKMEDSGLEKPRTIVVSKLPKELKYSYEVAESSSILRVDNSNPSSEEGHNLFTDTHKTLPSRSQKQISRSLFRKRKLGFVESSGKSCCVVDCSPIKKSKH